MKLVLKLKFILTFTMLFALVSCESEDSEPAKSNAELIGSGKAWKLNSVTANGMNIISLLDDCLLDDLITLYYKNGGNTGELDAGDIKCNIKDPQITDFTWTYNDTSKILSFNSDVIDIPGSEGELSLVSVNENELVLSQKIIITGISQTVKLTLIH